MSSPGRVIHERIVGELEGFLREISGVVDENLRVRLGDLLERLRGIQPPPLPTRRYGGAVEKLVYRFNILRETYAAFSEGRAGPEDLRSMLRGLEEAVEEYERVCRGERRRVLLIASMPPAIIVAGVAYQVLAIGASGLPEAAAAAVLAAASFLLMTRSLWAGSILGAVAGIIAMYSALLAASSAPGAAEMSAATLLITFYMVSTILSISYIHVARSAGSEKTARKINDFMSMLLTPSPMGEASDRGSQDKDIYGELLEAYRELYGEAGREYLSYRLSLLIMSGFMRDAALRKLLDEVKSFKKASA